jgi:outer membrane lipoprotein carrier protein
VSRALPRKGQPRCWPFALLAFALLPLLVTQSAHAQTAQQMAAIVDRHYNTLRSLRVAFTESYAGLGTDRQETGTLLLAKPGRMRWDYAKPEGKLFVLDGKYGWFYSPGDAQVQRIAASRLDDLRSPLRFLLGHAQLAKELTGLTLAHEGASFRLSGVPRGMEQRIRALELTVTADGSIQQMTLEELDGSRTGFAFRDEQANPALSKDVFRFTPPPGIPVVEGTPPV